MLDPNSLVATRSRRANAGSNLRKLIEIEEQATGASNIVYTGDDENVELLFQEDENDVEFEESGSDEGENSSEQSDNEGEEIAEGETKGESVESDQNVNSDEMLSDSDLSASDNDDSEGERNLQKRERENKRKKKPHSIIPAIKKPRLQASKPKSQQPQTKHSELLLTHDRRASSRKSAVKNKETLVKKLKEDETRRAALAPVVRVKERKLTQEERLAQAVETERENVKSLHSFLEQEIVKKERQKLLFQQRRLKLRDVIRLSSKLSYVAPLDEIEDARYVHNVIEKKKKGKRRRTAADTVEETFLPGAVDTSLPYYREEMERKRQHEELESKKEPPEDLPSNEIEQNKVSSSALPSVENLVEAHTVSKVSPSETDSVKSPNATTDKSEPQSSKIDLISESDSQKIDENLQTNQKQPNGGKKMDIPRDREASVEASEKTVQDTKQPHDDDSVSGDAKVEKEDIMEYSLDDQPGGSLEKGSIGPEIESDLSGEAVTNKSIANLQSLEEERGLITNAGEPPTESIANENTSLAELDSDAAEEEAKEIVVIWRKDTDGSIFEGPPQLVSRNYVSLIEFEGERLLPLANNKVKTILFGEGANSGASRRLRDVKTILKSSIRLDNPYSIPKEEKEDELMKPVTEISEEDGIFEALRRIPRLGTKEILEELEEDDQKEEASAIEIRTEAPTGLYLPNENKKLCLINGREVRYFDPGTGIPYDNKEGYKIIKSVESGNFPWLSLPKDQNTYGEVEIYLSRREGARHAKGVPEGFDGF